MSEAKSVLPQTSKEIKFSDEDIERFWSKVSKMENGCWEWMTGTNPSGYGKFWLGGQTLSSHRVAFMIENGPIPEGMFICHKCDNPSCCNPAHLFLGSSRDNIDDMVAKGRTLKGERNNGAILTESDVSQIKELYSSGEFSSRKLAKQFNVAKSTILRIVNGHCWSHSDNKSGSSSVSELRQIAAARRNTHAVCDEDVLAVYNLYFSGKLSAKKIGDTFGVAKRTILSIINGNYAARVPLPPHIPSFEALRQIAISRRRCRAA